MISASWTYVTCLALQGDAWLVAGAIQNQWVAGGALLIGLASTVVSVVGGTARQTLTPDNLLSVAMKKSPLVAKSESPVLAR